MTEPKSRPPGTSVVYPIYITEKYDEKDNSSEPFLRFGQNKVLSFQCGYQYRARVTGSRDIC